MIGTSAITQTLLPFSRNEDREEKLGLCCCKKRKTIVHTRLHLAGIPERELEKLKEEAANLGKSSFAFAFYMDRQKEERERGVTIACTTKEFFTDKWHYTIIDAPGHRDFIKNMISCVSPSPCVLVLVFLSVCVVLGRDFFMNLQDLSSRITPPPLLPALARAVVLCLASFMRVSWLRLCLCSCLCVDVACCSVAFFRCPKGWGYKGIGQSVSVHTHTFLRAYQTN